MEEPYVTHIWEFLRTSIVEIQRKNNSGLSFEELYRNAYTMVLHKHGDRLYNGLRDVVAQHLVAERTRLLNVLDSHGDLLRELVQTWNEHHMAMVMIRDIFMVYDQVKKNIGGVYNLGLTLFRENIARFPALCEALRRILLEMVSAERRGEIIDRCANHTFNSRYLLVHCSLSLLIFFQSIAQVCLRNASSARS